MRRLADIVTLLQEQNLLMRELILALTHQPAQTTPSRISARLPTLTPPPRRMPLREFTSKDVTIVTAAMREQQAIADFERQNRPWRIQDLPPHAQEAALASMPERDYLLTPTPPTTTRPK